MLRVDIDNSNSSGGANSSNSPSYKLICNWYSWTPPSCLRTCYATPTNPIEIPCSNDAINKCVEYAPTKCTPDDSVAKSNCKIVTRKGYTCPSGWSAFGTDCCKN